MILTLCAGYYRTHFLSQTYFLFSFFSATKLSNECNQIPISCKRPPTCFGCTLYSRVHCGSGTASFLIYSPSPIPPEFGMHKLCTSVLIPYAHSCCWGGRVQTTRDNSVLLRNTRCQPDASPRGPSQRGRPATAQAVNLPAAELRSDRVSTDARDMLNLAVPGILLQCCERICRKRK